MEDKARQKEDERQGESWSKKEKKRYFDTQIYWWTCRKQKNRMTVGETYKTNRELERPIDAHRKYESVEDRKRKI